MMKIESLADKPDRAGRYLIRFDDGTTMRLYRQTVEDHALYPGRELEEGELKELRVAAGQMSAKMRAVRIVSASSVSKDDLLQRLIRKGESPHQAEEAVNWMSELNLVDDAETARQIVSRCIARGYGLARVKQMLYEKRIPKDYWQQTLEDYPDQQEKIRQFLSSRLISESDEKERKRAVDALLRRGHSYGQISKALRQLDFDEFPED